MLYFVSWQDLIAVGYGEFEFSDQKSGLICCWCLKNPDVCTMILIFINVTQN